MSALWWAIPLMILCVLAVSTIINTLTFPRLTGAGTHTTLVSVLIPARNEAHVIGQTVRRLLEQEHPHLEVLVLDDESQDGTAQVAQRAAAGDPRLRVMSGEPLPAGWGGKNWACHQLSQAAAGDVLVFTDADVRWSPAAVGAVLVLLEQAEMVTVWPTQITRTWAERLTVPLMGFVILAYLPEWAVRFVPWSIFAAANGQCLAFRRAAYEQVGGHEAVKATVIEDIDLAKAIKRTGGRLIMADGNGLIRCRMYTSWAEVREGYAKNILAGHGGVAPLALSTVFHWGLFLVPWVWLLVGWGGPLWPDVPASFVALGLGIRMLSAAVTHQRVGDAVLLPFSVVLMTLIAIRSLGKVEWKGREIVSAT